MVITFCLYICCSSSSLRSSTFRFWGLSRDILLFFFNFSSEERELNRLSRRAIRPYQIRALRRCRPKDSRELQTVLHGRNEEPSREATGVQGEQIPPRGMPPSPLYPLLLLPSAIMPGSVFSRGSACDIFRRRLANDVSKCRSRISCAKEETS